MYVLTDGTNYVMENDLKKGDYLQTTDCSKAKKFTYKQARTLLQNNKKRYSWIREYHLIDIDTGERSKLSLYYKGNAGIYMDNNEFDSSVLYQIIEESSSIINLAAWNIDELNSYKELLCEELSRWDSAESDVKHALETYKTENNNKKPQAHKMAKVGYLLDDIRDKHKQIKQCINYIKVMQDAATYHFSISKLKEELQKSRYVKYKGRTKYYQMAMNILNGIKGEDL